MFIDGAGNIGLFHQTQNIFCRNKRQIGGSLADENYGCINYLFGLADKHHRRMHGPARDPIGKRLCRRCTTGKRHGEPSRAVTPVAISHRAASVCSDQNAGSSSISVAPPASELPHVPPTGSVPAVTHEGVGLPTCA